jgi:predicted nucleotide-binding protein (sugar kinase/HSP70/actin superfamily)
MNTLVKQQITYSWWCPTLKSVPQSIKNVLHKTALDKISILYGRGQTTGELKTSIENYDFTGWFEVQ